MGRYASRPEWLDKNFSQADTDEAVEEQAKAHAAANKARLEAVKERDDLKLALEKEKIYRDQAEQKAREYEEKATQKQDPATNYDPYANQGYQSEEDKYKEIAKKAYEEEKKREQMEEFKKIATENLNGLKSKVGIDKYREIEPKLSKIADTYRLWDSPYAPNIAYDIYEKEQATQREKDAKEAELLKQEKIKGGGGEGGGAQAEGTGANPDAKYDGKTAKEVVEGILGQKLP